MPGARPAGRGLPPWLRRGGARQWRLSPSPVPRLFSATGLCGTSESTPDTHQLRSRIREAPWDKGSHVRPVCGSGSRDASSNIHLHRHRGGRCQCAGSEKAVFRRCGTRPGYAAGYRSAGRPRADSLCCSVVCCGFLPTNPVGMCTATSAAGDSLFHGPRANSSARLLVALT
jgi:hypothetical protein